MLINALKFPSREVHTVPTYEYECNSCRNRFDLKQSFNDEPVGICPICSEKAHRVFHSVPIFFKGSGFYCTDHGRGSRTSASAPKDKATVPQTAKKEGETGSSSSAIDREAE